jgi:hypothetical protein
MGEVGRRMGVAIWEGRGGTIAGKSLTAGEKVIR